MKHDDNEKVMRLHGFTGSAGLPAYLFRCDFEANRGRGEVLWTVERDKAMRFDNPGAALAYWKTPSQTVPLRPDGQPNRPLSAFTIEIVPAEQPASATLCKSAA
ncbi:hypothetical protein [Bosea vestrisii]|uniref:Uncharacterized protein n=1 Tax=Bosea vestrisii TaxID=151416 RepID=A0ABW0H221_9HYPH